MAETSIPKKRGRPGLTEENQQAIQTAARAILSEAGVDGLRARRLAERAGVATGSLYKFYPDMDAIIGAVNLDTYRDLTAHLLQAMDACSQPGQLDRLMTLARAYLGFVSSHGQLWSVLLDYNRGQTGRGEMFVQAEDVLFGIIEHELASLPRLEQAHYAPLARALWASVHGIVLQTLPNSTHADPVEDTLFQIEMIVGAVVRDYS